MAGGRAWEFDTGLSACLSILCTGLHLILEQVLWDKQVVKVIELVGVWAKIQTLVSHVNSVRIFWEGFMELKGLAWAILWLDWAANLAPSEICVLKWLAGYM